MKLACSTLLVVGVTAVFAAAGPVATVEHRFALLSLVDQSGQPVLGLGPESFTVEVDGAAGEVVGVTPASYPLAIVLDTSSYAVADFRALQSTVETFLEAMAPRQMAVYASGEPSSRLAAFTTDRRQLAKAVARAAAAPTGAPRTLETILRASKDLAALKAPVTGIVAFSSGGLEMNPPSGDAVWAALRASHSMLNVVESRTLRLERGMPQREGDVLEALARRTRGTYQHGVSAAVYVSGLAAVRRQLDSQSVLEYVVAPGASSSVTFHVEPPATIAMAVGLDR